MLESTTSRQPTIVDLSLQAIFPDYNPSMLENQLVSAHWASIFLPQPATFTQSLVRLGFQTFSNYSPRPVRALVSGLGHKLRRKQPNEMIMPAQCGFNKLVTQLRSQGLQSKNYLGRRAAVCLSYDVDRLICYGYLPVILDQLTHLKFKATFNLLTDWEYKIDQAILDRFIQDGHEIGLHGGRHDVALGYRRAKKIRLHLNKALEQLPAGIYSYRAPALCITPTLLNQIKQTGFVIDSSLPMSNLYYHSVQTCFPYPLDAKGIIWELPVLLQDTTLFLDFGYSIEQALALVLKALGEVVQMGGVAVLNLHPYMIIKHQVFHTELLTYLAQDENVAVCTQKEVYKILTT